VGVFLKLPDKKPIKTFVEYSKVSESEEMPTLMGLKTGFAKFIVVIESHGGIL
jgi:hypothetical protein